MDRYHDVQATELFLCGVNCIANFRLFPDICLHSEGFDIGMLLMDYLRSPLGSL